MLVVAFANCCVATWLGPSARAPGRRSRRVGPSFWDKARNGNRSMRENRIRLINAVLRRD